MPIIYTPPSYLQDFQLEESSGVSTTTSSDFQTKLTMVVPAGLTGTYRIAFSLEWAITNAGARGPVRLYNDTDAAELIQSDFRGAQSNLYYLITGTAYLALAATTKTILLQFRSYNGSDTVSVRRAIVEFWRAR